MIHIKDTNTGKYYFAPSKICRDRKRRCKWTRHRNRATIFTDYDDAEIHFKKFFGRSESLRRLYGEFLRAEMPSEDKFFTFT